jgi:hypothetical protein
MGLHSPRMSQRCRTIFSPSLVWRICWKWRQDETQGARWWRCQRYATQLWKNVMLHRNLFTKRSSLRFFTDSWKILKAWGVSIGDHFPSLSKFLICTKHCELSKHVQTRRRTAIPGVPKVLCGGLVWIGRESESFARRRRHWKDILHKFSSAIWIHMLIHADSYGPYGSIWLFYAFLLAALLRKAQVMEETCLSLHRFPSSPTSSSWCSKQIVLFQSFPLVQSVFNLFHVAMVALNHAMSEMFSGRLRCYKSPY